MALREEIHFLKDILKGIGSFFSHFSLCPPVLTAAAQHFSSSA